MKTIPLGRDGPAVTIATLGTMTFGRQNTEAEAHDQLDLALERGVNDAIHLRHANPAP